MKALVEQVIREEVRSVVREYFGSLLELERGPVFQIHASMTKQGLTKAVRKTKRSQLADMKIGEVMFVKAPKGMDVKLLQSRWSSSCTKMQNITEYKWKVNRDFERGGVHVTRVR